MNNGRSIDGFPASYVHIGNGSFLGIAVSDLLLLVMMGIGIFITQFTPTGNRIYALGGNETVVRQEGINVDGLKLFVRSEEHTSELQSRQYLVCRLLLEKKNKILYNIHHSRTQKMTEILKKMN